MTAQTYSLRRIFFPHVFFIRMLIMWPEPEHLYHDLYILPRCLLFFLYVPAVRFVRNTSEQIRFIVYVRVVSVRCGTLLQPMLVIDLSASNSLGAGVVLPKLHHYFVKLSS
ncbi:uncharacterized protein LOC124326657 [Daphnia pulicaria]|uniref:uncharacterized protein LOC124326657 n=1 Tax=Daphnia pulicaria TaxID=35523 RepID=UPI001EEB2919|nr:uncharacterized protein LOC124326657 [Daphnia pulicaria]